jgi:hypothetical protein
MLMALSNNTTGGKFYGYKDRYYGIVQKTHAVAIFDMKGYITSVQYN